MRCVWLALTLGVVLLAPQSVLAQAPESTWLIALWHGVLEGGYSADEGPGRMLSVGAVGPGGTARGTWLVIGREERSAQIRVDGEKVTVFPLPLSGSVLEATRQGPDQLVGTFRGYPVTLTKVVASASQWQRDPLIGTWEGSVHIAGAGDSAYRTLVIQLTSGNLASGLYGYTGKSLDAVEITVDRSGPRPSIAFVTGANSQVVLTLMNETSLVGNLHLSKQSAGFGLQDWKIALRKVE